MGMDYQCAPDDYQLYHPVCPGNDLGSYCDGGGDCTESTELCDCEAGQKYCKEKFNVCDPTSADQVCHFYIEYDDYLPFENPKRMSCERSTGEQDASYSYFWSSCCSNNGYFSTSITSGGFQLRGWFEVNDQICEDYSWEMSTLLCSPDQGKYIEDNTLRVCLSSCQALFDACGLPGVNFPSWAEYTDATSLCYAAWGGFYYDSPCESNPESPLCQNGIINLEVVEGEDCLGLPEELPSLHLNDVCARSSESSDGNGSASWFAPLAVFVAFVCLGGKRYFRKLKQKQNSNEISPGGQDTVQGSNDGASGTNAVVGVSSSPTESIPVTSALVGVPVANNAIPTPVLPEPATNAEQPSAPPADKDLTFDQTMDMQSLEFKLRMDAITQAEFEEMKKEILDR